MQGIDMNDFYMCINVNQDGMIYFKNYRQVRKIKLIPNFLNSVILLIYFVFI